ncbi:hypothetical protein DETS111669_32155 [Delftia tsuruhatensis]
MAEQRQTWLERIKSQPFAGAFPEEGEEAVMPMSRARAGFWRRLAARIFRGAR